MTQIALHQSIGEIASFIPFILYLGGWGLPRARYEASEIACLPILNYVSFDKTNRLAFLGVILSLYIRPKNFGLVGEFHRLRFCRFPDISCIQIYSKSIGY